MQESVFVQNEFDFTFEDGYDTDDVPTLPAEKEQTYQTLESASLRALQQNPEITALFDDLTCINQLYAPHTNGAPHEPDAKSAYLLFKAHDALTDERIIIKTTNPAFTLTQADATLNAMLTWEAALLTHLKNKKRCQKLIYPLKDTFITLQHENESCRLPVSFFATGFLSVDVKKSFFDEANDRLEPIANRLMLFASIISAVQSLHREGIAHRDLKPSNIMGRRENKKITAVAIDLGSALASHDLIEKLRLFPPDFCDSRAYCAPELLCGFEDDFTFGCSSDMYALGCMLFELLDKRTFFTALQEANGKGYYAFMNNCYVDKTEENGILERRKEHYDNCLDALAQTIQIPTISESSPLPPFAHKTLQTLINQLTAFDYRKRVQETELDTIKETLRSLSKRLKDAHIHALYKARRKA